MPLTVSGSKRLYPAATQIEHSKISGGLSVTVALVLFISACTHEEPANYFPPPEAEGGWRKDTSAGFVRSLGLVPDNVKQFGAYNISIKNSQIPGYDYGLHKSAMVIKSGWIVGEWYAGADGQDYRNYLSSIGKSFAIAGFGVLVNDSLNGKLPQGVSGESRLYDHRWLDEGFPLSDPQKQVITFDQVLQHTSGISPVRSAKGNLVTRGYGDWSDYGKWVLGKDERWPQTGKLYFDPGKPGQFPASATEGGHVNAYSDVAFAHLGLVFRSLYGQPAHEFLWHRLLDPIGFSGIAFHEPPNESEHWFSAGGLAMTTRDLARFAYLLLRDGRWRDTRLLPENWLGKMLATPDYPNLRSNVDGFFGEQYPPDMFRLFGSGGNFVFIVPSLDLIAIRTGRTANALMKVLQRDFLRRTFLMVQGFEQE